ncbi:hypothetical protein [Pajaroellobacter abortibovis]|nr:hypothetical protein [Pajaroellobacter abortibovis]
MLSYGLFLWKEARKTFFLPSSATQDIWEEIEWIMAPDQLGWMGK